MLEREEPEIIFGQCQPITKQEILAAVPPRHIVDRLVSGFFFSYESMAPSKFESGGFGFIVHLTDLNSCRAQLDVSKRGVEPDSFVSVWFLQSRLVNNFE